MARPSLGPAYGDIDKATPARLLGGIPQASSQGAIGTESLQAPVLQAVSQLVETFSAPGQPSTLRGPVELPAAPQMGAPQRLPVSGIPEVGAPIQATLPRPPQLPGSYVGENRTQEQIVQQNSVIRTSYLEPNWTPFTDNSRQRSAELRQLSSVLGNFSPYFDELNRQVAIREERIDKKAKDQGGVLAAQAGQVGQFGSLQEFQKELERGVAEGRAGYAEMLQRFQAADPRALRYAAVGIQDAYVKNSLATLKERVNQTKTLLDGRSTETVKPEDPEFQRMMTAMAFPKGMSGLMPEVLATNSQQLQAIYGSIMSDQQKKVGAYKTQKAKEGLAAVRDGNAVQLVNGALPVEQIAANLTNGLDGFYSSSGQTREEYQKELEGFAENFTESVLSASGGNWSKDKAAIAKIPEVLAQVRVGPAQDGDKRPLLLDVIGGMPALYKITQKVQEKVVAQQNLMDNLEGREAKEQVAVDIKQAFTPEVLADPARIDATENQLLVRGQQLYGDNPEMAMAYTEQVRKHTAGIRAGFVQPVQEQNEVNLWAEMAQNPGVDFTGKIMQLQQSQQISFSAAKSFLATQASRNREDNKANYQVLRGLQDDLKKRLEAQYARGSSDGGANLTPNEARQMWQMLGELYKSGDAMIRKAPGQDVTKQLGDLYGNALGKALPQQQSAAPAGATPESIAKGLAPGGRGNPQQNQQLRRQAETRPLYAKERMGQQLDSILQGQPLDESTRQIIRRSGLKPSDFFTRQMQLHGIPLDTEIQKRLKELDGSELVSQAPAAPNPYMPVAQRLGMQFANTIANAFIPPAAAATRGSFPFTGSPIRVTGGMGGLLGLIRSGEGGWNSVNRGRAGDSNPIGNLTSMPIGVVEDMQRRNRVFAVGAYQFTPGVLTRARKEAGLSPNAPMSPENQNRMAMALITGSKRPALAAYIRGESNNLTAAHRDIALEWAALQGPGGRGMYDGDRAGNMASIPATRVRAALQEARRAYLSGRN